jgi:hypothetical protein
MSIRIERRYPMHAATNPARPATKKDFRTEEPREIPMNEGRRTMASTRSAPKNRMARETVSPDRITTTG